MGLEYHEGAERPMTDSKILAFLLLVGLVPAAPLWAADAATWLAFGELRGYLEPCGCDPATDLGGLRRLSAALSRERAETKEVLVFDLGRNLPFAGDEAGHKAPFLAEGVAALAPAASLFNETELLHLEGGGHVPEHLLELARPLAGHDHVRHKWRKPVVSATRRPSWITGSDQPRPFCCTLRR